MAELNEKGFLKMVLNNCKTTAIESMIRNFSHLMDVSDQLIFDIHTELNGGNCYFNIMKDHDTVKMKMDVIDAIIRFLEDYKEGIYQRSKSDEIKVMRSQFNA